jgi:exportin-5
MQYLTLSFLFVQIGGQGDKFQALAGFLRLLVDLLHHPSGRVCGEQINTWIILLRDPQISKSSLLTPFAEELMTCYMEHVSKIRWEDVDEGTHPQSDLMEASWDDEEEYDSWSGEYRSRSTQFFKLMGNVQPQIATSVLSSRTQMMLTQYGNGAPQDHLHAGNNQLTPKSESVMQFEGLNQPLDTTLAGLPVWALKEDNDGQRSQIRSIVQASLSQMATAIVSWNPTYLWLKFRRAQMLEAMKHFWVYIPTGLNQGIEALLGYLSAEDDWSPGASKLSGEVIGLRKKSGVSLVAVSKKVPHHLVPWISQLSEAVRMHLSSSTLLPPNRMHLYEFLSCVATAVQDPVARSTFISDVLSDAISVLESADFKQSVSSPESFLAWLGITEAGSNPASATNPQHVGNVTSSFVRVFSALNQILSVGKRCHEANKKRPFGGIPLQNATASLEGPGLNFPDEGPVSLQDLVMNDPFVPLWPRILPSLLQILDVALRIWHPSFQAVLLQNPVQKYVLAISDDEAYLSKVHDTKSGGVFGEGGTAGSVVTGTDRRDQNLVPRWSGWFNELRNTCFQMLGLLCGQRALFAPELGGLYPQFVAVVANPDHIRAMENRQLAQYL